MATQAALVPKKRWIHIIPAAFLMYTIAFMDRVNIGFAIPGIEKSLAVSATIAGLASGIFFVGYVLLQIPGGQLAMKWSAKRFVFFSLIAWGIFAILTGLAQNVTQLLIIRFFLGVAEGGVWHAGSPWKNGHAPTPTGCSAYPLPPSSPRPSQVGYSPGLI